jgi:chromosome segregation ATPase
MSEDNDIKIEPTNIDLNSLFNLTYTFDNLKLLIGNLKKNQDLIFTLLNENNKNNKEFHDYQENRFKSIEDALNKLGAEVNDVKRPSIDDKFTNIQNIIESQKKNLDDNQNDDEDISRTNKKISTDAKKKKTLENEENGLNSSQRNENGENENEEENNNENNESLNSTDKNNLNDLYKKIQALEKKVRSLELQKFGGNSINDLEKNALENVSMNSLNQKFEELRLKNKELEDKVNELTIKVSDFNIYDLFDNAKMEGGNIDASKLLISALEQKVFKKIGIMDDKIKKIEEDIYKSKNDFQNIKNQNEVNNHTFQGFKDMMKELTNQIQQSSDENSNKVNDLEAKLNEIYKKLLKKSDEDHNKINEDINSLKEKLGGININENDDNIKNNTGNAELNDNDLKFLKDIAKRVSVLESSIKIIIQNMNSLDQIKDDLLKLSNEMQLKTPQKDFYDLNDKVNVQAAILNNLKDNYDRLQDEVNKHSTDLNFLLKKLESINSTVIKLKEGLNENGSGVVQGGIFDENKYVELATFNSFLKSYESEISKIKFQIEELRRYLNDLNEIVKTKASEEDMRNFETLINSKIEELRLLCNKKFADKIDTSKSLKYLDAQIKHIVDVYIKRMEKGDNWLLAKKPVGGFTCASCEAYIGELKEKNDYLAWNKYPMRENDKAYRIGNGFSRMLNMLNLDVKNSSFDPMENSDNETKSKSPNKDLNSNVNNSTVLPNIQNYKDPMGQSMGDNLNGQGKDYNTSGNNNNDEPKIMKVYRKNK